MYPLGHLGIALVIATIFYIPVAAVVVGVFLPDIVDKGFAILGLVDCGRSIAHNVFFAIGAGAVALAITRKKSIAFAIFLGILLHLAQDSAGFVPYFYPIVEYDFSDCGPVEIHPGTFEIVMEIVGFSLIIIWWRFKSKLIYLRERIFKTRRFKRVFG